MLHPNLNLKVFIQELLSFALIGTLGIFVALNIKKAVPFETAAPAVVMPWWQFLLAFGIGTAVILGLIRIMHGGFILRLFFIFALFSGLLITFSLILPDVAALISAAILIGLYLFWPYVWLHDLVLIFTLPGIGTLVGLSLHPWFAVLLLALMSFYDYIAVYKTKHMVKMARAMIAGRAIFAMIFPERFRNFKMRTDEAHPGQGFMMLGTGDFVFPLIMAASASYVGRSAPWLVLGFSFIGLLVMHLFFVTQKIRKPIPALPPLAAFAILGFLIATLLTKWY